jgi:hypothetical protein
VAVAAPAADSSNVTIDVRKDHIDFKIGNELVTTYHVPADASKPYLWPLNAPGGVAVTRAFPMDKAGAISTDHPHHVSGWFCHGDVIPEGVALPRRNKDIEGVDFWSVNPARGVIACVETDRPTGNGVRMRNEWRAPDGRKVLDETRTVALYDLGGPRLIVMTTDLKPSAGPVVFGDTKEGSFAVRVHDQLRVGDRGKKNPKSRITNADGKQGEKDCWGYPSNWCDYSGELDGKPVGITVFDDPGNLPRACWHVRDYGLMGANPFGRGKSGFPAMKGRADLFRLNSGEHLKLRYGILLHAGDVETGKVAACYEQFLKLKD